MNGTERRRQVLREVEGCVCRDRQNTYGDAEDNFANIAAIWNVIFREHLEHPLTASDVARAMVAVKLARTIQSPNHRDNWVDMAGYAVCGAGIQAGSEPSAPSATAELATFFPASKS